MKDTRVVNLVEDLKSTVERLNRLSDILSKTETTFSLTRKTRDGHFTLEDITQRVSYLNDKN